MIESFVADLPFLMETVINGLLFGGVLALLSLGLIQHPLAGPIRKLRCIGSNEPDI